jgi:hypothetical protein
MERGTVRMELGRATDTVYMVTDTVHTVRDTVVNTVYKEVVVDKVLYKVLYTVLYICKVSMDLNMMDYKSYTFLLYIDNI